ncbi:MAG: bifunctional DNA primase/polymerase, partial [Flavobacteriales bacterium]
MYIKHLALQYYKLGFNITCISTTVSEFNFKTASSRKSPSHPWSHLQIERQCFEEFSSYDWDNAIGFGTVAGFRDIHVLDIDGCSNLNFLEDILLLLGLPKNYEWVVQSGSHEGFHIYFHSKKPENLEEVHLTTSFQSNIDNWGLFEKIEFLWRTNVVLPGSLHKTGYTYEFLNTSFPESFPQTIDLDRFAPLYTLFLSEKDPYYIPDYFKLDNWGHEENIVNSDFKDNSILKYIIIEIDIDESSKNINHISWAILALKSKTLYKKNIALINKDNGDTTPTLNSQKISRNLKEVLLEISYDIKACNIIVAHDLAYQIGILSNLFRTNHVLINLNNYSFFCLKEHSVQIIERYEKEPKPLNYSPFEL